VTCGLSAYRYSNYSRFKYDVAMWHLLNFDRALEMVPSSAIFVRFGEEHPLAAVWGHADGIVLQLHAAFDTWACALAHRCGWQSSDQASFRELAGNALPATTEMKAVRRVLDPILTVDEWIRLVELRDRAAHRTIVGGSLRLNDEAPSVAYFEHDSASGGQGTEVLPDLRRLALWADGPLEWMWQIAEVWRQPDEDSVIGTSSDRHAQRSGAAERLRRQLGL
jgi:hypothetical protein